MAIDSSDSVSRPRGSTFDRATCRSLAELSILRCNTGNIDKLENSTSPIKIIRIQQFLNMLINWRGSFVIHR